MYTAYVKYVRVQYVMFAFTEERESNKQHAIENIDVRNYIRKINTYK